MRKGKVIDKPWKLIVLIILEVVVFGLVYWLLAVRFFPDNEAIRNAIVIIFILAVGITIILHGNVTRHRNLNVLGFAVFLFAVFVVIDTYEGFAVKISAFAALAVAFAAFAAIDENRRLRLERREQEEKARLERREQEKKAEKERMLNEIESWAKRLFRSAVVLARPVGSASEVGKSMLQCRSELLLTMAERIKVQTVCGNLSLKAGISASDEVKIKKSMELVNGSLDGLFADIGEVLTKEMKGAKALEALQERAGSLSSNVGSLLKVVSEIAVA